MSADGPRFIVDAPYYAHRSGWAVFDRYGDDQTRFAHFLREEDALEYAAWKEEQYELRTRRLGQCDTATA